MGSTTPRASAARWTRGVHLGVRDGVDPVRLPQEQLLQLGRRVVDPVVDRQRARNATGFSRSSSAVTSRWYAIGPQSVTATSVVVAAPDTRPASGARSPGRR